MMPKDRRAQGKIEVPFFNLLNMISQVRCTKTKKKKQKTKPKYNVLKNKIFKTLIVLLLILSYLVIYIYYIDRYSKIFAR